MAEPPDPADPLDPLDPLGSPQLPPRPKPARRFSPYTVFVGVAFIALVTFAGLNTLRTSDGGVLGAKGASGDGDALAEFALVDARGSLKGDANIAQDDCETAGRPCLESDERTPACKVDEPGSIRICDYFDRPLVLSFWFTRGGDCESEQDVFEGASRRFGDRVGFLAINVRDSREEVQKLISRRGWTHTIGLDTDGAVSNLYRVGGCPTFIYVYPGGIIQTTSIGTLTEAQLTANVEALEKASERRAAETAQAG